MYRAPRVAPLAGEEIWFNVRSFRNQSFLRVTGIGAGSAAAGMAHGAGKASAEPVLSHPDYDRRLRNHTGSADPPDQAGGARGLWEGSHLPPVGNCTPP